MSSKFIDAHEAARWVASGDTGCTNKINLCAFPNIVSFALVRQFSRPDAKRAPLPAKGTTLLEAL